MQDKSIGTPTGNLVHLFQVMFTYSDYDDATVDAISQIRKLNIEFICWKCVVVANSIEAVQSITSMALLLSLS